MGVLIAARQHNHRRSPGEDGGDRESRTAGHEDGCAGIDIAPRELKFLVSGRYASEGEIAGAVGTATR
jgi:hypothetical protein